MQAPVREADAQAQAAGLSTTPTFLIGSKAGTGKQLDVGRLTADDFTAALDAELKR